MYVLPGSLGSIGRILVLGITREQALIVKVPDNKTLDFVNAMYFEILTSDAFIVRISSESWRAAALLEVPCNEAVSIHATRLRLVTGIQTMSIVTNFIQAAFGIKHASGLTNV